MPTLGQRCHAIWNVPVYNIRKFDFVDLEKKKTIVYIYIYIKKKKVLYIRYPLNQLNTVSHVIIITDIYKTDVDIHMRQFGSYAVVLNSSFFIFNMKIGLA